MNPPFQVGLAYALKDGILPRISSVATDLRTFESALNAGLVSTKQLWVAGLHGLSTGSQATDHAIIAAAPSVSPAITPVDGRETPDGTVSQTLVSPVHGPAPPPSHEITHGPSLRPLAAPMPALTRDETAGKLAMPVIGANLPTNSPVMRIATPPATLSGPTLRTDGALSVANLGARADGHTRPGTVTALATPPISPRNMRSEPMEGEDGLQAPSWARQLAAYSGTSQAGELAAVSWSVARFGQGMSGEPESGTWFAPLDQAPRAPRPARADMGGGQRQSGSSASDDTINPQQDVATAGAGSQESQGAMQGDVFLDGAMVGRWVSRLMSKEAGRASAGPTGFDSRRNVLLPGATVGG